MWTRPADVADEQGNRGGQARAHARSVHEGIQAGGGKAKSPDLQDNHGILY